MIARIAFAAASMLVVGLAAIAAIANAATQPPFAAAPVCGAGQALTRTAAGLACLEMPAPDLSAYQTRAEAATTAAAAQGAASAVAAIPTCAGSGQYLTRLANGGWSCVGLPAVDLSPYETKAAVQTLAARVPDPCASAPPGDSLMGGAGAMGCFQRGDATRPTVVQAATATTDAAGAFSIAWARPFSGSAPYVTVQPLNAAGAQPVICNVTATTATTAAGRCWKTVKMTLPGLAAALLGLVLDPTAAAGATPVRVAGRDLTQ